MREIIRDRQLVRDDWTIVRLAEGDTVESVVIPDRPVLVPLALWQARRDELLARNEVGVWIASHERAEALRDDVARLQLIAVDFPKFSDGRGYSIAWNLRTRLKYPGELRAIGDVLRDQLYYLQRVGFNAFAIRADRDVRDALKGLDDFSESYQASWQPRLPLYRRHQRPVSALASTEHSTEQR